MWMGQHLCHPHKSGEQGPPEAHHPWLRGVREAVTGFSGAASVRRALTHIRAATSILCSQQNGMMGGKKICFKNRNEKPNA